ncbi:MAG: hypothetical protein ACK4PI_11530 [Tepidisphaerales bacterium]
MSGRDDVAAFRRSWVLGVTMRRALLLLVLACAVLFVFSLGSVLVAGGIFLAAVVAFAYLEWRANKLNRRVDAAVDQMDSGDLDAVEAALCGAIRSLTLYPERRAADLLHLARVRYLQQRYGEAARLAGTVGRLRRGVPEKLTWLGHRMALGVALEIGDTRSAYESLTQLSRVQLPPSDAGWFVLSRTRYELAVGAYGHVLHDLVGKLRQVGTLPAMHQAAFCVVAAEAADASGRADWAGFLRERAAALLAGRLDLLETASADDRFPGETCLRWFRRRGGQETG